MISGKPVKSSIARTSMPASASSPRCRRSRRSPRRARAGPAPARPGRACRTPTAAPGGCAPRRARRLHAAGASLISSLSEAMPRAYPSSRPRSGADCAARAQRTGREQPHGAGSSSCSSGRRAASTSPGLRLLELDRALQDHRAGVDPAVDEVDGDAEHLDAVVERLLDRGRGPGTRAAARGGR